MDYLYKHGCNSFFFLSKCYKYIYSKYFQDPRYYMLILLPQERNGLEKLLYSLQWCPIRGIINQLKLTAVYATVPVFTIVKHVNLVPALAKVSFSSYTYF